LVLPVKRRNGAPPDEVRAEHSQYAVAEAMDLSRARIMQIERAALAKLRRALERVGIDGPVEPRAPHWSDEGESEGEP
jgi:hypothetical protein